VHDYVFILIYFSPYFSASRSKSFYFLIVLRYFYLFLSKGRSVFNL